MSPVSLEDKKAVQCNPMGICAASLIVGIISVAIVFGTDMASAGFIIGAVGLVLGGYAINVANRSQDKNRMILLAFAAIGIFTSIFGFIFGLAIFV